MSAPPLKTSISDTYPNPSNATAREGFGALYDYVTSFPFGQCRLVKSGANLVLQRYNGLWLTINNVVCTIPSAGVSLAATGLTPGTTYNIYAYMSGATMTLEASTTAHSADTTTGVEIKTGDATRSLVGKATVLAGPVWTDTINQRLVVSWFNRKPILCQAALGGNTTNTSTSAAELSTTLQNQFLSWGEAASFSFDGYASNSTSGAVCRSGLNLDGTTMLETFNIAQDVGGNLLVPVSVTGVVTPSEGYHYVTAYVSVSTGTGTWGGSGTTGGRCSVKGLIWG